jgi:GAF domain-containing protein
MASNLDAGHAIAAAARALYQGQTLDETLQRIVDVARTSVPGFDHVGISTVDKKGHPTTRAAAGDLVEVLDAVQYDLGEGPCVDALREADAVVAPDLAADRRWPRYVPAAVQHGVRSQMAIKLYLDEEGTLGGLNLYSTASSAIDPQAEPMAELFATHAALALGNAREKATLNEALSTRQVIGQAIGIVMERYDISSGRAFDFLVRASSVGNHKLRDVAQELVAQRDRLGGPPPVEGRPGPPVSSPSRP